MRNSSTTFPAILAAFAVSISIAHAGDVKVRAVTSTGPEDEPTATFTTATSRVFALFKTKGLQKRNKVRAVWLAEDSVDSAAKGAKLDQESLTLDGDTDDGVFSLSRPAKGWSTGNYRVEIYVGDDLVTAAKFTITAKKSTGDDEDDDEDEDGSLDD